MPHVAVCISTFRRPDLLALLLRKLVELEGEDQFAVTIVIADNDPEASAEYVVREFEKRYMRKVVYCHEPKQNIALARNKALSCADGEYIALIDDDEYPHPAWLRHLYGQCSETGIAGALGPVVPYFEGNAPAWATRGRFFERKRHPSGTVMRARDCRTGNVLFKKSVLSRLDRAFNPEFGVGGEDIDFFERLIGAGNAFVWCDEALVYEKVPASRCSRRYLLRRALLQGHISLHHKEGRLVRSAKSVLAIPAYAICLPIAWLLGEAHGLRLAIKLCYHLGRFLALFNIALVKTRDS